MNKTFRVGIVGVSGYSGMETARLVAAHPALTLGAAVSDKWAGAALGEHLPVTGGAAGVRVVKQAEAHATFAGLELVFLCTPAEVSIALAPEALRAGARVVDLSGGFRLAPELYPRWYGFPHPRPDLLASANRPASSSTRRAGRRAPARRPPRTSRSPRSTATSAPTACCGTSTRPRS